MADGGRNELLLQYAHPPTATVPSRFGQVNPASTMTLYTRSPNFSWSQRLYERKRSSFTTVAISVGLHRGGAHCNKRRTCGEDDCGASGRSVLGDRESAVLP